MELNWENIVIDFTEIDNNEIIKNWIWLIGEDKSPIMISCIGDMFLEGTGGKVYWLNVGDGTIEEVANSKEEFLSKMNESEISANWFMFGLVSEIYDSGLTPKPGKLFSYKVPPVVGGEYVPDNFEIKDIIEHFDFSGDLHKKIKDLPEGTPITILDE